MEGWWRGESEEECNVIIAGVAFQEALYSDTCHRRNGAQGWGIKELPFFFFFI